MLSSMTGFGSASTQVQGSVLSVSVESLNSKQLDIKIASPHFVNYDFFDWQKKIGLLLKRGRVKATVRYDPIKDPNNHLLSREKIETYYKELQDISHRLKATPALFGLAIHLSQKEGSTSGQVLNEEEISALDHLLEEALNACIERRKEEGKILQKQIECCFQAIKSHMSGISELTEKRSHNLRKKLEEKIKIRENAVDLERWEQEVLYYLERIDIEEEVTRLKSHWHFFIEIMSSHEPMGKKMSFLLQEIGRELNTLGSKAQDVTLQHLVVEMKNLLEQVKEQAFNIL